MRRIGQDKWKHFWVGIAMGIFLQALGLLFLPSAAVLATTIVFAIVIIISYGFELYSKITGHGHHEIMDAVAAIIGGVVGMGIVLIFQWLLL
jgi:hypothetical protein